jgi:hypothetical protein
VTRLPGLFKAFAGCAVFGAVWLTAHLLEGSRSFDAREAFNVTQAWLAFVALQLLLSSAPRWMLASAAAVPIALVFAQAQQQGTWVGVAAGAQWLAFAALGDGAGAMGAAETPPRAPRSMWAAPVVGLVLEAWALQAQPRWAPVGAAMVALGLAGSVVAPTLSAERRAAFSLRGAFGPLLLFLTLFLLAVVTPGRGRLFACGLAYAFGWLEGRKR